MPTSVVGGTTGFMSKTKPPNIEEKAALIKSKNGSKTGTGSVGPNYRDNPHITDAYKQFLHRITEQYKVCEQPENRSTAEIELLLGMKPGNTSQFGLDMRKWLYFASIPLSFGLVCLPCCLYYVKSEQFVVPNNHFALVEDRTTAKPETKMYGPGYHFLGLYQYLKEIVTLQKRAQHNIVQSSLGDLTIITVDQGTIALFEYNGQYKILGPGLHLIRDTVQFCDVIRLDKFYIKVGPEKWVTIPDQYDGIAIDNGEVVVLAGGKQHHLTHENYSFAKLVPKILLTDRIVTDVPKYVQQLGSTGGELPAICDAFDPAYYLRAKTKDGAIIFLDAMLFWLIVDTNVAAHKAMAIMELRKGPGVGAEDESVHIATASRNIDNLRKTVLRFSKACLAEAIGRVCLTDDEFFTSKFAADERQKTDTQSATLNEHDTTSVVTMNFAIQNFLNDRALDLVQILNRDLAEYGVRVEKLTINDALPMPEVQEQLDQQAKAKIDRNTALVFAETERQVCEETMRTDKIKRLGEANNMYDAARVAKATMITEAEAIAEKERIIALGRKDAAELQESTTLGKQLAVLQAVSDASRTFNTGGGEKVYIVGSPMEAISRVAGNLVPGLTSALTGARI